tara:strand:+ start:2399 stop:2914 length:516 start_codon:yes stop_codon:yes gene_type:complete
MTQLIRLEDTGQRTIDDTTNVFTNKVNGGTGFNIAVNQVSFSQGLELDNKTEVNNFINPTIGTAGSSSGKITLAGSLDVNGGNTVILKHIAQLARTRGLIKVYGNESAYLPNFIAYNDGVGTAQNFSDEALISSGNPAYARVNSVSIRQLADSPFRVVYAITLLVHSEIQQ